MEIEKKRKMLLLNCAALAIHRELENRKKRNQRRRWWVHPVNRQRAEQGHFNNLIQEMRLQDGEMFFNYTRMSPKMFDKLLSLVGPNIKKHSHRAPISESCRLLLTLGFMAAGDSLQSIAYNYRIGKSTACIMARETCIALWDVLQPLYLQLPTSQKRKSIASDFEELWNIPHCLGALNGKHIAIQAPHNSGSMYYNYKKHYSIVLFEVCDARYKFTYVDIGAFGSQGDGGIFRLCSLGQMLNNNTLDLPEDSPFPGKLEAKPYFFVGDEAFPLQEHLLGPYGGRYLERKQQIYNYRTSRARRCIENIFGILAAQWIIFYQVIDAFPENVEYFVKATVCLHNFIKTNKGINENTTYSSTDWKNEINVNDAFQHVHSSGRRTGSRNANIQSIRFREYVADYFLNPEEKVNWQDEHVGACN